MRNITLKILFVIISYIVSSVIIYMALTDSGIFRSRFENKLKTISVETVKGFQKTLDKCKVITESISKDPNIKLILFQSEIGGNRREYINYLSRLRSSVANVYKIIVLRNDGSFIVSSDYFDREFREFQLAKKYFNNQDIVFFGNFDILYSIIKVYDQRGIERGYVVVGWYKDMFKQSTFDVKNLKFVQNLILINFPEKITKETFESSVFVKKAIINENIKRYNLSVLFFKSNITLDPLNIIIIILSLLFSLMITLWFITTLFAERKIETVKEIEEEVFSSIEDNFYQSSLKEENKDYLESDYSYLPSSQQSYEDRYKYEEIESDIMPYQGSLAEREVFSVRDAFDYIYSRLGISKIMFMRRVEDGFVQTESIGFETDDFVILFSDKVWEKFLSKGKAVSIKGDIKELYELGSRIKDDLFELTIFPVIDSFGDVRYLFVVGRKWTENEPGLELKKEVFSKIKYIIIQ